MTNFQVYKKTISFSLVRFAFDFLVLLLAIGLSVAGFFIADSMEVDAVIGLIIGFALGIVVMVLVSIFVSNRYKAAHIAMITKGTTEDSLPEHTFKEGMNEIKGRFASITAFFFVTGAIKGIFRQIGRGINRIGTAIGGESGNAVTNAVNSAIQTLIGYLCDCCLGWVFFRKELSTGKAALEGAAIFFKHGKTLLKNIGRIFIFGFLSFVVFGGAFTAIFYLIFSNSPAIFESIAQDFIAAGETNELITNPQFLSLYAAVLVGVILFSIFHSVLVRPFILTGVIRNFMEAGRNDIPSENDFAEVAGKYSKFAKLQNKIE